MTDRFLTQQPKQYSTTTRILKLGEPVRLSQTELLKLRDTETYKQVLTYSAIYVGNTVQKVHMYMGDQTTTCVLKIFSGFIYWLLVF